MNEVSDGRSVGRVPISAKYVQDWPASSKNGGDHWDEIAWLLPRIFPQDSRLVATNLFPLCQLLRSKSTSRTYRIEVSQCSNAPRRVGPSDVCKNRLAHELRAAVGGGETQNSG
jgi:hypothetical protein